MADRVPRRFGVLLRRARTKKGLTTRGLAELVESSNPQVTNWELAHIPHPLNEERVDALAQVLEVDRDELFYALLAEQFVLGLPEPLLKDLRQDLVRAIAAHYSDDPTSGSGLTAGGGPDGRETRHKPIRIARHGETVGDKTDAGDESIRGLRRKALIETLAESGYMDESLARAALRGKAAIPAEEVELLVGRLLNPIQLADLLLILQVQVVVDMRDGTGTERPVLRLGT